MSASTAFLNTNPSLATGTEQPAVQTEQHAPVVSPIALWEANTAISAVQSILGGYLGDKSKTFVVFDIDDTIAGPPQEHAPNASSSINTDLAAMGWIPGSASRDVAPMAHLLRGMTPWAMDDPNDATGRKHGNDVGHWRDEELAVRPEVEAMYRIARGLGFRVAFVTARRDDPSTRRSTNNLLYRLGFGDFPVIVFTPESWRKSSADIGEFKRIARGSLGGHVVLSVGDQWTDVFAKPDVTIASLPNDRAYILSHPPTSRENAAWGLKLPPSPWDA